MIEVKDLMCGNWVNDTVLGKVIVLNNLPYSIDLSHSEPIPVTVDMLKRIGFEEYEDSLLERSFYRYWDKDYKYKLDVYPDFCNSDRIFSIHIDNEYCETIGSGEFTYVHELQNLVRINCRADLPVTKEMIDGNIDK